MRGLKFKLSGVTFEDKSLPVLTSDPMAVNGSLMLLDVSQFPSGIPASGTELPNQVEKLALPVVGKESHVQFYSGIVDPTISKIQRTEKGGIYFAGKPGVITNPYPNGQFLHIESYGGIKDYVMDKYKMSDKSANHEFYVSIWIDIVKPAVGSGFFVSQFCHSSNHNTARIYFIERATAPNTPAAKARIAATFSYGNADPTSSNTVHYPFTAGRSGINGYKSEAREMESTIFYRYYMEDLTVSGRTRAEVDALDQKLFTEAFAEGGKFYNDTFQTPAQIFG